MSEVGGFFRPGNCFVSVVSNNNTWLFNDCAFHHLGRHGVLEALVWSHRTSMRSSSRHSRVLEAAILKKIVFGNPKIKKSNLSSFRVLQKEANLVEALRHCIMDKISTSIDITICPNEAVLRGSLFEP